MTKKIYLNIGGHEPHKQIAICPRIVYDGGVDKRGFRVENSADVLWHQMGDGLENSSVSGKCRPNFADAVVLQPEIETHEFMNLDNLVRRIPHENLFNYRKPTFVGSRRVFESLRDGFPTVSPRPSCNDTNARNID